MEQLFLHYLTLWRPLGYSLVFLGVFFEGDIFILITAGLTRLGYFDVFDMLFLVYVGVVLGDSLWFWAGRHFSIIENRFFEKIMNNVKKFPIKGHSSLFKKLLISKFMYGTHHPFLFILGAGREVSFLNFLRNEVVAVGVWIFVLGNIGYWFTGALLNVKHIVKYAEVSLLIIVIVYVAVIQILKRKRQVNEI